MKMYYFKGPIDNFGDELNTWLMPKIFPNFFDDDESDLFLGIGSVIFDHHPAKSRKIVYGSGYGGYTALPVLDEKWLFYCVRGPDTAKACGLGPEKIAADTAILMNKYRTIGRPAGKGAAFMPHWNTVARGNWARACELAGVRYVDPSWPVERVLAEIEASSMVIAEAMHFAITADALRVPFVPLVPFHTSHRMKWLDWAAPLELDLRPYRFWPSTLREAYVAIRGDREGEGIVKTKGVLRAGVRAVDQLFVRAAAARLKYLATVPPQMSSDAAMARAVERLETKADEIRRDFTK